MAGLIACAAILLSSRVASAQDLIVDGTTVTLGGYHTYNQVRVINNGRIVVPAYNGTDRANTGNLIIVARSIFVDSTSRIDARGAGYQTLQCGDGRGPNANAGGQGGCSVRDSGGGGGHFGAGGRGTKDCFVFGSATSCQFPQEFEEDCGNSINGAGTACTNTSNCWNNDALPTNAGQAFRHSIYDVEFGASGGDKGCRDGDGFGAQPRVGGPGGGRVVLAGLTSTNTGTVQIDGLVTANGRRGCGTGNDSGGGGAGGSVLIVGDTVTVGASARVTAAGGLGGDTLAGAAGSPDSSDCPAGSQTSGTCDDCGGGGGGGIITVLSRTSALSYSARFDVMGAVGGTCTICQGEAGGNAGELQLDGAYVGEVCDGYDNDFDLSTDEGLPMLPCGMPSCVAGRPQICPSVPGCGMPATDTRPRLLVIMDSSGSMLTDLTGLPTYGDGSAGHVGIDADGDGTQGNDSKLFIAKDALAEVFFGYPEMDYAFARYHQDQSVNRSCQLAHWFECQDICCTYDDPRDNTAPAAIPACTLDLGGSGSQVVNRVSTNGGECINYAGSCGPPERGADVLVGFGADPYQHLMWLDGGETNFVNDTTEGNFCRYSSGGDCEVRGTGPTPLAGSLEAAADYLTPIRTCDAAAACRNYGVVLLTDGAETCGGDPVAAATALYTAGIETHVIGFSVLPTENAEMNAIAMAGSGGTRAAYLAADRDDLSAALANIVAESLVFEVCNGLDDDCDTRIDEGVTNACGGCGALPAETCNGTDDDCDTRTDEGVSNACGGCGPAPVEVCDNIDNDCDGLRDEGGVCGCAAPEQEICDNRDNDCDTRIDEGVTRSCGRAVGICTVGTQACAAGVWGTCTGVQPATEVCDNRDNDCDGVVDGISRACGSDVGECQAGTQICTTGAWGTCTGSIGTRTEACDSLDNDCDTRTDEGNPGGGGSCGSTIGDCDPGAYQCMSGGLVCVGGTGPSPETCDGNDDDCDGNTDEGVASPGACGSAVGECREGARQCMGGAFVCVGGRGPATETCDGRDNDCDTRTDEGNPGGNVLCGSATGECERGRTACMAGVLTCTGGTGPSPEMCNTLDDDCDSLVDEGNPGAGMSCGTSDVGECELGAVTCVDGALICVGETGPIAEACDEVDNDCDGNTDEGDPEGGGACGDDTGECEPGVLHCIDGDLLCEGGTGPTDEVCDGLDNDCDGVPDEGIPVGAPCGSDVGECTPGLNVCRDGTVVCDGAIGEATEVCDSLDNDCDGNIDENLPLGEECGSEEGACMPGALQCVSGRPVCVGEVPPGRETCDCDDNDCDGTIDEAPSSGSLCPSGSACVDCQCALPCIQGEIGFLCPTGKAPTVNGEGDCFCVAERCNLADCQTQTIERDGTTRCAPDSELVATCTCKNNECSFPCEGVVCAEGTVCDPRDEDGRCVENSCRGLGCPSGQLCNALSGECETDPCEGVTCSAEQACRNGTCETSCARVECEDNQTCESGQCVTDRCRGVQCGSGQTCNPADGTCVDNLCRGVRCPTGAVCDLLTGECVADPCRTLHCPENQVCIDGECELDRSRIDAGTGGRDAGTPDGGGGTAKGSRVFATGGGGCVCEAAPGAPKQASPALGLLTLLGLLVVTGRRRRK